MLVQADLSALLLAVAAAIVFTLGSLHAWVTLRGSLLEPRDRTLKALMQATSPVISGQTTYWNALQGFHLSHSLGAMLFGALYGWAAVSKPALLGEPTFMLIGAGFLSAMALIARRHWFSIPQRGLYLATALFLASGLLQL